VPAEELSDGSWRDVIDPALATEGGQRYILYGSFNGGTLARLLTDDGLNTVPSSEVQLSPSNRYEASYVIQRLGYYYLFLSAGTCCSGAGSGYGVYAPPICSAPISTKTAFRSWIPTLAGLPCC
jgi:beta-xylosidase